jgi:hypothetical protein
MAELRGPWQPRVSRRCMRAGRGEHEWVTCHVVERGRSGLVRTPTSRGKGNLSHANFMTLLPLLLLFERNREQGGREEGDDAWVP